jgi:uncharacterized protein
MSFDSFVLKIASRCNLNCNYCYVYNLGDDSWRSQPRLMSESVARTAAIRIHEHALARGLTDVVINFHGGEPFLGGVRHLRSVHSAISEVFAGNKIQFSTAIQSNGLLFTSEIGDALSELGIGLYISMDGPPQVHDRQRVDLRGRPTGAALAAKMNEISSPRYRNVFMGMLCVVDPESDPGEVFGYLASFRPPLVDFLLPLNNHDRPPPHPVSDYGDWLCACFDHWMDMGCAVRVRTFEDIILGIIGERADDSDSEYLVIETDGSIELDDTLKSAYPGASVLGMSVFKHDLEAVSRVPRVAAIRHDISRLSKKCQTCPIVSACHGGHVSHRYSERNGLANPSVYCSALEKLIMHIWRRLQTEVSVARKKSA